ncbi:glycosyltransferase family 2 protein [Spiribacter onubensis]|uniref:Glycosyltransferase family 2 protein n=1 Tax=Spiribacter onubensis TaxID=3122420 RepID=A0ABV3SB88_9GAMM
MKTPENKTGSRCKTLLSICIPTYNRESLVVALVKSLISFSGNFEICIHVDGSTDNTFQALYELKDPRLRVLSSENRGRAEALKSAVRSANGRFCMLFDDDDELDKSGFCRILHDCSKPLPTKYAGRVYHLADDCGERIGSLFPEEETNLTALRADYGIDGDKKEVVRTGLLKQAVVMNSTFRRVPTSLYWARISLGYDIVCVNEIVGRKRYLQNGMSSSISGLKKNNIGPMIALHQAIVLLFLKGRIRSSKFALRSLFAIFLYFFLRLLRGLKGRPAIHDRR